LAGFKGDWDCRKSLFFSCAASGGVKGDTGKRKSPNADAIMIDILISVPSNGSRKAIDSCRLPTGEVYTPHPNESSGNALSYPGRKYLYGR
jgi:hypothetical protein